LRRGIAVEKEDLKHNQVIEKTLQIVNPFAAV